MFLASLVFLSGCFLFRFRVRYPAPEVPEGYQLIDAYEAGYVEDYVKVIHAGIFGEISAVIQYHDPNTRQWEMYGGAHLYHRNYIDTLVGSEEVGGGLERLRYFAIRFSDGIRRPLRLSNSHNDLRIFVGD